MTYFLNIVLKLLLSLLHLLIIRKYMKIFLGVEYRSIRSHIEWCIYYVFLYLGNTSNIFPPHLILIGNILLIFLICSATRKQSVMQRCIFSVLICTIWMLVEVILMMILRTVGFDNLLLQDAGSFLSEMFMFLLSVLISHCIKDNYYSEISLPCFLIILLIPISSIYIMHHIFIIVAVHREYTIFSATASLLLLIVNYAVFEVYDWIRRNAELREQNSLYAQQLELCSQQAAERENLYDEIRTIRHDLKNYLSGLLGMVRNGQIAEAEKYILQMLDNGIKNRPEDISHSGNIVVDSLVNQINALTQEEHINFNVSVLIPATLPFENGHIAIILGNLLDNALEACRAVTEDKKFIYLDISYAKELFQIIIRNSYQSKRKKSKLDHYLTTKSDTIYHGLGISSVQHAIENYHGDMEISDSGNEFQVVVIMYASDAGNSN